MSQTEGIVLNEIRFKETSKILNIYTKDLGKVNVMARGASRPKSKLMSITQPFNHCEYEFYKGRSWYYINEGTMVNSYYNIREDIDRLIYGFYILELVNKSTPEEEKNELLFLLLEKSLTILSEMEEGFLKFIIAFELKFISFIGYRPSLKECVNCGNTNMKDIRFSIARGGFICESCMAIDYKAFIVDRPMYEAMLQLLYIELENLDDIDVEHDTLMKIQNIMEKYILYSIDREEFNSLNMLKTIM